MYVVCVGLMCCVCGVYRSVVYVVCIGLLCCVCGVYRSVVLRMWCV